MLFIRTKEGNESRNGQLSLDFSQNASFSQKERVADHIHAITSGKIVFHPESDKIDEHNFYLKISYMGRSYSVNGTYKKEQVRSFYQKENADNTNIRIIGFGNAFAFRDGQYTIPVELPKTVYDEITKNAQHILANPTWTNNATIH